MEYRIGIDVGGTFTDFLLAGGRGRTAAHKELSTPADPSEAVLRGLAALAQGEGLDLKRFLGRVRIIVHGTTVTTNAVLTGRTARTGLLTTRGFRDALQMRRGVREEMYDNRWHPPEPIVPRWLRLPATERVAADGTLVAVLDGADVERAARLFRAEGVEAVAVCFLHAHANPRNERAAGRILRRRLPRTYLSLSSAVLPQVRFYERTSTTVLNAAVGPILAGYLGRLAARLRAARYRGRLLIMQSNGGVASPAAVSRLAASTLLSGPAAAPAAGLACMAPRRERSFISMDMGGTSFDAALVRDGAPAVSASAAVNRYALALPSMEINTVGAGGGSIAWIDQGGLLRMGPASAGAEPGPACYGRGGAAPTCTDANLVLGYLAADYFAGGRMPLDTAAARRAIRERIARPLGLSLERAAHGMLRVINVNMAAAIREISVKKGYDPREFPLVCAGGAGALHAAGIAAELEIARVVVPRDASIFCAAGMLRTDLRHDYVRSCARLLDGGAALARRVHGLARELRAAARRALTAEGIPASLQRMRFALDLRYLGQYHEVTVEVPEKELASARWDAVRERFHAQHDRLYGYALRAEGTAVELLNLRLAASGGVPRPPLGRQPRRAADCSGARKGRRAAWLAPRGGFRQVPVYDGERLGHGNRLRGPAIIETANTSIVVPHGWHAQYDAFGSCILGT
ncbi:MAG: hydantoinase/oxoprolinase family protein [Burkholderiales bacterium]|nr:hydantoinase/oxoprolinase family protein [Burkholderiales bacterium]